MTKTNDDKQYTEAEQEVVDAIVELGYEVSCNHDSVNAAFKAMATKGDHKVEGTGYTQSAALLSLSKAVQVDKGAHG